MNILLKIITLFIFSFNVNANTGCVKGNCENGKGTKTFYDGTTYTGDWLNGKWDGKGTVTFYNGNTYTGDWVNGKRTGKGVEIFDDGTTYTGDYVNDERIGKGTYTYSNGDVVTGYYLNDKYWGTVAEWSAKVAKEKVEQYKSQRETSNTTTVNVFPKGD